MTTLTPGALQAYDEAGRIVKKIKSSLPEKTKAGTGLLELAEFVEGEIARLGGKPAFPCNISINEIASHCTPPPGDRRTLQPGDVVKFDLGATIDGYIADSAVTIEAGPGRHAPLIAAAEQALADAIAAIRPGVTAGAIGGIIEASARRNGFSVLRSLYGHNLEHDCLHGGLTIPNYDDGSRQKVRDGDVIAIEPFLTPGSGEIVRLRGGDIFQLIRRNCFVPEGREKILLSHIERNYNGFPFARRWLPDPDGADRLARMSIAIEYPMLVEKDGAVVAQAEHTIIVGRDGNRIIT
ncbi:MAG: Methionine aminopeptidase [Methanocella sp. PtaU1.Bin125]|nr:MAG: Methionine aminopeptidase [Methanocella sp. PtaU1.Bin125]